MIRPLNLQVHRSDHKSIPPVSCAWGKYIRLGSYIILICFVVKIWMKVLKISMIEATEVLEMPLFLWELKGQPKLQDFKANLIWHKIMKVLGKEWRQSQEAPRTQGLRTALCGPWDTFHALQRTSNQDPTAQRNLFGNREEQGKASGERK